MGRDQDTAFAAAPPMPICSSSGHPADIVILDAETPEQAIAEISRPLACFKNGRQTVRWHAPELLR